LVNGEQKEKRASSDDATLGLVQRPRSNWWQLTEVAHNNIAHATKRHIAAVRLDLSKPIINPAELR
jgi:hypothetical protein